MTCTNHLKNKQYQEEENEELGGLWGMNAPPLPDDHLNQFSTKRNVSNTTCKTHTHTQFISH
jgi:hypothetical protein